MSSRQITMRRHGDSGFTLIELLVTMVVVALTLGAAVGLFNSMNKLSRVQLHTAEMQQAVRVAQREAGRLIQMAGRGGLAGVNNVGAAFDTPALSLRDNVGPSNPFPAFTSREIAPGHTDSPVAVEGTDILTVRGAFASSVFHVNYADKAHFNGAGQTVTLGNRTPTGIPQDLRPIKWACDPPDDPGNARPEALLLVNAVNEESYAVVELDCSRTEFGAIPDAFDPSAAYAEYDVGFLIASDGTAVHAADYARLSPNGANPVLTGNFNPSFVALIEEYRFYLREKCRTPEGLEWDCGTLLPNGEPPLLDPRFSMARVYPHTNEPHGGADSNLELDLADSIFEFQVALGFDSSYDGSQGDNGYFTFDADNLPGDGSVGDDDSIVESTTGASDDWLFNSTSDGVAHFTALPWTPSLTPPAFTDLRPQPRLYYLRVSTLGFTARPDRGYQAPIIDQIENHPLTTAADDPINGTEARLHRRELLQSVIDMRNLG